MEIGHLCTYINYIPIFLEELAFEGLPTSRTVGITTKPFQAILDKLCDLARALLAVHATFQQYRHDLAIPGLQEF